MKKLILMAMPVCALFAFTGCSGDDIPNTPNTAAEIAGTYNGYSYSESVRQAFPWTADLEALTITAGADNTASLSFASKGQWGTYTVEKITLVKSGDAYKVSGSGKVAIGGMGGGAATNYDFTMTGTIKSTSGAEIVFVATVGGMGEVTTTFVTGDMPNALKIVGNYSGYVHAKTINNSYVDEYYDDLKLIITVNDDNTVNLNLDVDTQWGEYNLENLEVKKDSDGYKLSGSGTGTLTMSGNTNNYPYTMEAVIVDSEDTEVVITYSIMGGTTLTFLTGTAPVE